MTIKKYLGKGVIFYPNGTHIWAQDDNGGHISLMDIKIGKTMQDAFTNSRGELNELALQAFQNRLGEFLQDAINEKLRKQP